MDKINQKNRQLLPIGRWDGVCGEFLYKGIFTENSGFTGYLRSTRKSVFRENGYYLKDNFLYGYDQELRHGNELFLRIIFD